jgi:hypothetical protein
MVRMVPSLAMYVFGATMNQHPPVHLEGWMDDKWSENSFLLKSSSVANHGD